MKKTLLLLIALFSISSSFACDKLFKSEDLCMNVNWEVMPTKTTPGKMILTFTANNDPGRFIDPKLTPFVQLWMPSMGHGSRPVTINRIENGKFSVSNIVFIMPGPWDIRYQLKNGTQVVEEIIQKINI